MIGKDKTSSNLPEGSVTFLFTDIERSTELLHQLGEGYKTLLADQRNILRDVFSRRNGEEVDTQGDSFFVAFPKATEALNACVEAQRAIAEHSWPDNVEVRIRMGLHTGEPWRTDEGYVGIDVHRAARIAHVGHGAQVLLSETVMDQVCDALPDGVSLLDLGSHRLKDIHQPEPIHQLVIEGLLSEFPPLTSLDSRPNNLPVQPTPFVGRVDELAALDALIADPQNRLITILGPGGMGKTRLAVATAEQQLQTMVSSNGEEKTRFPDGAFFVGLAPLDREEAIIPAIGQATGFQFYEGVDSKTQLLNYFRRKRMLLVMDNFEHLKAGASLLAEITQEAPDVKILVSSREKLGLRSEIIHPLQGMVFPDENQIEDTDELFSAIAMFLQCARRAQPAFTPDKQEMASIGRICRLVEGMPLALELAASWIDILSPADIAWEVQKGFDLLASELDDVPYRHRSIHAVFNSTWNMLDESEQAILARISVFRGGFSLDAANKIVGASKEQLLGLMNKSLLQRGYENRLGIHELLRQFAAEKLAQNKEDEVRARDLHCEFFANFLHDREAQIDGGEQREALVEIDNLRSGWRWAARRKRVAEIHKQIHSMYWLHNFQGWYQEGVDVFQLAVNTLENLKGASEGGITFGWLLAMLGALRCQAGEGESGLGLIREGRTILRRHKSTVELASVNRCFAFHCGDPTCQDEAEEFMLESLEQDKGNDISWQVASNLNAMGNIRLYQHRYDEAEDYYQRGLDIASRIMNRRIIGWSNSGLGFVAVNQFEYKKAQEHFEEVIKIFSEIEFIKQVAHHLNSLGNLHCLQGNVDAAEKYHQEALEIHEDKGFGGGIAWSYYGLGDVAYERGEYKQAKGLFEKALIGYQSMDGMGGITHGSLLCELGKVAVALGDDHAAERNFINAFKIAIQHDNERLCLKVLEGVSSLLMFRGDLIRSTKISSLATSHPNSGVSTPMYARNRLKELENRLSVEAYASAVEQGRELDVWETAKDMLTELKGTS